jgi:hypothetical protein
MLNKGWGTTRLNLFDIMFKCGPYNSLFVCLGATQLIVFFCLSFVPIFWIKKVLTGMISYFIPTSPTVIIIGSYIVLAGTAVNALLF